jgi:hypothetical protein
MVEAIITCETSINFYRTTWGNNPTDSHLHNRRLEILKSQIFEVNENVTVSMPQFTSGNYQFEGV